MAPKRSLCQQYQRLREPERGNLRLKDHGVAVIRISHRMDDIFYCCDRVMALYQGTNFADAKLSNPNRNEVIGWIMDTKGHNAELAHDKVK
jgi:simple sugar transport system ATP-binding protein